MADGGRREGPPEVGDGHRLNGVPLLGHQPGLHAAVGAHAARMEYRRSRARKRHRLVEAFAARMHGAVRGRKRLAGTHEVVDAVDVVKVK